MSLISQINKKISKNSELEKEYYRLYLLKREQEKLEAKKKILELYPEIKELHNQPFKLNIIYYDNSYDPLPPQKCSKSLTLKVEMNLSSPFIRIMLYGWLFSYSSIIITFNTTNNNFHIESQGYNKKFPTRNYSSVSDVKEYIIEILSNLNEF